MQTILNTALRQESSVPMLYSSLGLYWSYLRSGSNEDELVVEECLAVDIALPKRRLVIEAAETQDVMRQSVCSRLFHEGIVFPFFEHKAAARGSTAAWSGNLPHIRDTPIKGATKCDNGCELQKSVKQWPLQRALRSWDMPESMPASVLLLSIGSAVPCMKGTAAACHCIRVCLVS